MPSSSSHLETALASRRRAKFCDMDKGLFNYGVKFRYCRYMTRGDALKQLQMFPRHEQRGCGRTVRAQVRVSQNKTDQLVHFTLLIGRPQAACTTPRRPASGTSILSRFGPAVRYACYWYQSALMWYVEELHLTYCCKGF